MNKEEILARLWEGYIEITPSAKKVYDLFNDRVEGEVENDHIAIRTFNDHRVPLISPPEVFILNHVESTNLKQRNYLLVTFNMLQTPKHRRFLLAN